MSKKIDEIIRYATDFSDLAKEKVSIEQLIQEGPKNAEQVEQLKIDFMDAAKHVIDAKDQDQQSMFIDILLDLAGPMRNIFSVK